MSEQPEHWTSTQWLRARLGVDDPRVDRRRSGPDGEQYEALCLQWERMTETDICPSDERTAS